MQETHAAICIGSMKFVPRNSLALHHLPNVAAQKQIVRAENAEQMGVPAVIAVSALSEKSVLQDYVAYPTALGSHAV